MIKKTIRRIRESALHLKIRTQLLLLLFAGAFASFCLYQFLWQSKWAIYDIITETTDWLPTADEDLFYNLALYASDYNLPASDDDTEAVKALQPYFDLADGYTSISIYGIEDGTYRAGCLPYLISEDTLFRRFFNIWYSISDGNGEDPMMLSIKFKNEYANLYILTYHRSVFLFPAFLLSLAASFLLFLAIILFFVTRKMKSAAKLEADILRMSSGDLTTPVDAGGFDELGVLSRELDHLRTALLENIRQEQESRTANHDLITAMSHDLRTPLTILNGYLEILNLERNPQMQKDYLKRCLEKTKEIREMTDRMFEYSLVYEPAAAADLQPVSADEFSLCLRENIDYIRLTGFTVRAETENLSGLTAVLADRTMVKRIFGNLFSNIIKYGDKKEPVFLTGSFQDSMLCITLSNCVREEYSKTDSSRIGLKSVRKMMKQMGGSFDTDVCENCFKASLAFCITDSPL